MSTPVPGLAFQTPNTPGQPVNALDIQLVGGYITNPISAPGPLFVDPTGPASTTANGTTLSLPVGQTFYAIPFSIVPVSVASNFANHSFISVQWST